MRIIVHQVFDGKILCILDHLNLVPSVLFAIFRNRVRVTRSGSDFCIVCTGLYWRSPRTWNSTAFCYLLHPRWALKNPIVEVLE